MGGAPKTTRRSGVTAWLQLAALPALLAVAVSLAAAMVVAGTPSSLPQRPARPAVAQAGVECTCHIDPNNCPAHGHHAQKAEHDRAADQSDRANSEPPRTGTGRAKGGLAAASVNCTCHIDPATCPCHGDGRGVAVRSLRFSVNSPAPAPVSPQPAEAPSQGPAAATGVLHRPSPVPSDAAPQPASTSLPQASPVLAGGGTKPWVRVPASPSTMPANVTPANVMPDNVMPPSSRARPIPAPQANDSVAKSPGAKPQRLPPLPAGGQGARSPAPVAARTGPRVPEKPLRSDASTQVRVAASMPRPAPAPHRNDEVLKPASTSPQPASPVLADATAGLPAGVVAKAGPQTCPPPGPRAPVQAQVAVVGVPAPHGSDGAPKPPTTTLQPASPVLPDAAAAPSAGVVAKAEPQTLPTPGAQAVSQAQVAVVSAPAPPGNNGAPQIPSATTQSLTPASGGVAAAGSPVPVVAATQPQAAPPQAVTPQQITINGAGSPVPVVSATQPQGVTPQPITINIVLGGVNGAGFPVQTPALPSAMPANVMPQPQPSQPQPSQPQASQPQASQAPQANLNTANRRGAQPQRLPPLPDAGQGAIPLAAYQQPMRLPTDDPQLGAEKKKEAGKEKSGGDSRPAGDPPTIGEAPAQPRPEFLRQQSILLDPGEYEFDFTLQYSNDQREFATAAINGNQLIIGDAHRRQRLLMGNLDFRLGISPVCQGFINLPVGWSDSEFSFAGVDEFGNTVGIGDVSGGMLYQLVEGDKECPSVLATLAFSAPTGESQLTTALSVPGSALGEGFFTTSVGLTFVQIYDPIIVFYGFGYRHRFDSTFQGGFDVAPGQQYFYRYGMGFAINPKVTVSATFLGSYIEEDTVNGFRIAGGIREPMQLRLGATISRHGKKDACQEGPKTIEPFLVFGLTDEAVDSAFGVSWTY
jgi:hypothetical protein